MNHKILLAILILLLIAISSIGVFAAGLYRFNWDNEASRIFTRYVPLPVAVVGKQVVAFGDFFARRDAYEHLTDQAAGSEQQAILRDLIQDKMIDQMLKQKGIRVSQNEIDAQFNYLMRKYQASGSPDDEIRSLFAWSVDEFKKYLVVPEVKKAKLATWLASEHKDAVARVNEAKAAIASSDFISAAKEKSDDVTSKYIGGDLGLRTEAELEPWLAAAVKNLQVKEISEPIPAPDGFHIIQVANRIDREIPVRVQISHILIKGPDVEEYVTAQEKDFRILIFRKL